MGSGTQMEFGNPLRAADCVVDLSGLSRITTYNPAELTIHVEAGATLGQIQSALAPNKQALPLDPWNGPSATIGGIAAANAQGPMRAIGGIRDWIIGMTVIHVDGRVSKTGGRVVKNVTGYDLAKLYTGSLGSLTVIAEISFKLKAQFPKTSTAIAEFENLQAALAVLGQNSKEPASADCVRARRRVWCGECYLDTVRRASGRCRLADRAAAGRRLEDYRRRPGIRSVGKASHCSMQSSDRWSFE